MLTLSDNVTLHSAKAVLERVAGNAREAGNVADYLSDDNREAGSFDYGWLAAYAETGADAIANILHLDGQLIRTKEGSEN